MESLKMNKILLTAALMFCSAALSAQMAKKKKPAKKKKSENIESVYTYLDSAAVPDKFKNESIVILGHYEKMKVIPPGQAFKLPGKTEQQVSNHYILEAFSITRFLLQDKNALEKFSTYYFAETELGKQSITIIKKNGERIEVDLTKAIQVKETISADVLEFSFGKYKKIALPGLEVGDMIEFSGTQLEIAINMSKPGKKASNSGNAIANFLSYQDYGFYSTPYGGTAGTGYFIAAVCFTVFYPHMISTKNPTFKRTEGYRIPEFTVHMNKPYPVVKQAYDVETPNPQLQIEYCVVNDAPKPNVSAKDNVQTMHIESEFNDAVSPEYFFYKNNNIPQVKYTFNLKKYEKYNMHYGNAEGRSFGEEDAKLLARKLITSKWKGNAITKVFDFEKEAGKKLRKMNDQEKLKYAYYYYKKNFALLTYILTKGDELVMEGSMASTKFFQLFCTRYDIPYEIVMYSQRSAGGTKNAVSGDFLRWGILAHPDGKDIYITDFDTYSEFNIPHQAMYGADVYYVNPGSGYSVRTEVFDPETNRNTVVVNTKASVVTEGTGLDLKSDFSVAGELKNDRYYMVCTRSDFFKQYETILGGEASEDDEADYLDLYYYSADFKDKDKQQQEKDRLNKNVEKVFESRQNDKYKDYLEEQYNKELTVNKVDIKDKGLTTLKSEDEEKIGFSVDYTMDRTVNAIANGSIVIELGRLISEQLEFKDLTDRTRKYAIDVNYPKSFDYTVALTLPAGYKVANPSDFEAKSDNDLCSFVSTVTEEGGQFVLHCTKTYKKVHAPAEEWNKMTEVMDTAAIMFQKKLLLEKN